MKAQPIRMIVVLAVLLSACGASDRGAAPVSEVPSTGTVVGTSLATPTTMIPTTTVIPTTTTPPTSTTPAGESDAGFIAYIGCSQTKLAVRGYQLSGGLRMEAYETGGGQINLWSRPGGQYWSRFEEAVEGKVITAAWMEICISSSHADDTRYQDVVAALEILKSKIPEGVPVYASGLEIFDPPDLCAIGALSADVTREHADRLASDGLALRGPDLGPLTAETTTDGCHPNRAGMELVGPQLLEFFG